jgi:hypothetical protein
MVLDPANGSVDVHSTDLRSAVVLHVMVLTCRLYA